MKVIVDLINKSFKVLENEKNIYVGNNNADVLKLYCYNGRYHLENEFVSITGLLSNGRKIGPFTTDSAYDEEYIDGKLHIVANFTLTKQNGFTLSEGQLNITIWHNKTNDSGAIISKQAIGNLLFNVVKTANVDENIIITDSSGDVIYNFKLEIENIQSAVNSVNNGLLLKADKNDIPTKVSQLENDTDYVDSERLTDVVDSLEAQIKRGGRTYFYSYDLTINNTVKELISKLKSYDKFDENNKGKFYIELSDGTVLEYISIEISSSRYYINSIIYKRTSIEVFQGQLPTTTTKTIEQLINEHKAITTKDYVDEKVANLVNSAPSTLDTLGELAAALEDNKDVVEALNEAITKKADITYVDEKIANAGIPTDLLDRVEILETKIPTKTSQLTNDSAFINQTQLDEALANVGSGGSVSLYKHTISIECYNFLEGEAYFDLTFYNLNSKSILEGAQDGAEASDKLFNYLYGKGKFDISTDYTDTNIATLFEAIYEDGVKKFDIYVPENATNNVAKYNIDELVINDYEPVLIGTTSGGTGSGASGKEVITADSDFYNSIYDRENTEEGSLFLDFINVDLDNKYIVVDLAQYDQDMQRAQSIEIFFNYKSIKNSTITINIPNCLPYEMQEKTCYFNFKDGGAILVDMAAEQLIGNVFDIDSYSNLKYEDSIEFGFGITSQTGQYQVKIDFDENGFANCIMYVFTEL